MTGHGVNDWDDESWSDADPARRRAWHHPWIPYAAVWFAVVGLVLVIGSVSAPGLRTLGGLLVIAAAPAIARADGPFQRAGTPRPPAPARSTFMAWLVLAAVLIAVGLWLFAR